MHQGPRAGQILMTALLIWSVCLTGLALWIVVTILLEKPGNVVTLIWLFLAGFGGLLWADFTTHGLDALRMSPRRQRLTPRLARERRQQSC